MTYEIEGSYTYAALVDDHRTYRFVMGDPGPTCVPAGHYQAQVKDSENGKTYDNPFTLDAAAFSLTLSCDPPAFTNYAGCKPTKIVWK